MTLRSIAAAITVRRVVVPHRVPQGAREAVRRLAT
jgi:hypothetical protein